MKKTYLRFRKISVLMLLCLALSGCGSGNDFEAGEYGNLDTNTSAETGGSSSESKAEKNEEYSTTKVGIQWDEEFKVGETDAFLYIDTEEIIKQSNLKRYSVSRVYDVEKKDAELLASLFGNSYKEIKSISYNDTSTYISFLYKYIVIVSSITGKTVKHQIENDLNFNIYYDHIIDHESGDKYDWVDNDKYYIHMYEGKYNGKRFGLLLAYDKVKQARYIYFKPISIDEYYPEKEFKTLQIRNTVDTNGNQCKEINECNLSYDEVKGEVGRFLVDELHLSELDAELGDGYKAYTRYCKPLMGALFSDYNSSKGEIAPDGMNQLVFSDSDFVHSYVEYNPAFDMNGIEVHTPDQNPRSFEILAEQDDLIEAALEKGESFTETLWDPYKHLGIDVEKEQITSFTYDGYALYINPEFLYTLEDDIEAYGRFSNKSYFDSTPINAGVIEITSGGIFGADIVQMLNIESVEEAQIIDVEKVKDSLKKSLTSKDMEEYIKDADYISVCEAFILYCFNENTNTIAPTWDFEAVGVSSGKLNDARQKASNTNADEELTGIEPDVKLHIYIDATSGDLVDIVKE